jgi:putative serine protease PepD
MNKYLATVAVAVLAAAGVGAAVGAAVALETDGDDSAVEATQTGTPVAETPSSAAAVYRRVKDGVVEIRASNAAGPGGATGSGFVIDDQGHIVTNQHVVEGAQAAQIEFADGTEETARVIGTDPSTDIAVLDIDRPADDLTPLPFAAAGSLEVGDPVIAIGSPFGLEGTLTTGIVSALGREIEAPNGFTIQNAVQTDAALNSGNSGGPLLDNAGRVIGVAAQIRSESGGSDGVGYAVLGETARKVSLELIDDGSVEHAYLGVSLSDEGGPQIVEVVDGSPADDAGLSPDDSVTAVDGKGIESGEDLRAAIDSKKPGDKLRLTITRDGDERTITVTLGSRLESAQ